MTDSTSTPHVVAACCIYNPEPEHAVEKATVAESDQGNEPFVSTDHGTPIWTASGHVMA